MLTCCEEPVNPRCTDRSQVEQKYKTTLDEASDFKMRPPKETNQCKWSYLKWIWGRHRKLVFKIFILNFLPDPIRYWPIFGYGETNLTMPEFFWGEVAP